MKLGHSQAERHQTLTLALPGSNPGGPANKKSTHLLVGQTVDKPLCLKTYLDIRGF